MKKFISKIFYSLLACLMCTLVVFPVSAMEEEKPSLLETYSLTKIKEMILYNEGIHIQDVDIIEYSLIDGQIHFSFVNDEGSGFYIFDNSPPDNFELKSFRTYASAGDTAKAIVKAVISVGKKVCKVVKAIAGTNVCAKIGHALLQTMIPNVQYMAKSVMYKNPNCVPIHSYQCNSAPNIYWKTELVRV